jgi:hypothetical protein
MKRWMWIGVLMMVASAAPAHAIDAGVGLAGGASFALAQSDNGNAGQLLLRVPVNIIPLLTIEPFLASADYDGVEAQFSGQTYNRRGFDIFSYGAIAALGGVGMGPRFPLYPYFGMGGFHLSREGTSGSENLGYLLGVGYGRALPANLSMNARAEYNWVMDGDTPRRFFGINLGLTLRFYPGLEEEM